MATANNTQMITINHHVAQNGDLISAGFPKFMNWGENPQHFPVPSNLNDVVITEKVWLSTDLNPSGEWVDVEQNATTYKLNAQGQITPNEDNIKVN